MNRERERESQKPTEKTRGKQLVWRPGGWKKGPQEVGNKGNSHKG